MSGSGHRLLSVARLSVSEPRAGRMLCGPLSFGIDHGRTLGIVGESGSGKTLTAMAVAGLLPGHLAAEGHVALDGATLPTGDAAASRDLRTAYTGVVFQNPSTALNPRLTVGAQLAEALAPDVRRDQARAVARCLTLLDEVGIREPERKLTAWPHELSGGIAQRVVIAMALARQPKLLIADEPTTALDVTVQAQILDLIAGLQRRHRFGVLLITHDMGVIRDRADEVVVMAGGRVVEHGGTEALFAAPRSNEAKTLLAASEFVLPEWNDPAGTAPGTPPLLEARGVRKTFRKGPQALAGVDLVVRPGISLGIVGESGSGKSTLARIIAGLERADAGAIRLDGEIRRPGTRSDLVQYVFQDPYSSLDPRLAVVDTVAEPLRAKGMRKADALKAARTLLDEVGLDPSLWERLPGRLSGGQRQRVGFARAIATRPKLLIADEPVAALDSTSRERVLALVQRLQARHGTAQLLISHDLSVVARLCSEVVVMRAGEIVERGPTRRIFETPAHPYTRQLLEAVPGRRRQPAPPIETIHATGETT